MTYQKPSIGTKPHTQCTLAIADGASRVVTIAWIPAEKAIQGGLVFLPQSTIRDRPWTIEKTHSTVNLN